MRARRAFTAWDGLLAAALVAANLYLFWQPSARPATLELTSDEGTRLLTLGAYRTVTVRGPLGITSVALDEGGARVTSSPCPNRLCLRAGRISRPGQTVACLPNRVALRLLGRRRFSPSRESVDAVTR